MRDNEANLAWLCGGNFKVDIEGRRVTHIKPQPDGTIQFYLIRPPETEMEKAIWSSGVGMSYIAENQQVFLEHEKGYTYIECKLNGEDAKFYHFQFWAEVPLTLEHM